MTHDNLVDPLPPHVSFGDTVKPPESVTYYLNDPLKHIRHYLFKKLQNILILNSFLCMEICYFQGVIYFENILLYA